MTGTGTVSDPYIIGNVTDLQNIELYKDAYYELGGNIDASATSGWNGGAGFNPIGKDSPFFTGHFDGKGYIVNALFINRPTEGYVGVFYYNHGTIQNVGLTNCDITGGNLGSLVGGNGNTGIIRRCYATGAVKGTSSYAGGLAQFNFQGTIQDCYSRCSVSGADYAGGFVGNNDTPGVIDNCYSTGAVSANILAGGFCSGNDGTISDCFWDTETSGQATSNGGTGKTTAQMKTKSTFTDAGWDFTTPIWKIAININNGYPYLLGSPLIAGNIAVKLYWLTYIDVDGVERYILGIPV